MKESQLALLAAVRASAAALIFAIDDFATSLDEPEETIEGICLHPEEQRMQIPTMNNTDRYMCKRCNTVIE